jgi:hypothetical protein
MNGRRRNAVSPYEIAWETCPESHGTERGECKDCDDLARKIQKLTLEQVEEALLGRVGQSHGR